MRLISSIFFVLAMGITSLSAKVWENCECYKPWNCCWLCGHSQDWYLQEASLDYPIEENNPPLNGEDGSTCFETCASAKCRLAFNYLIYRTAVEEKCYLQEGDLVKEGLLYKGSSAFDLMRAFTMSKEGTPLAYYGQFVERVALFTKLSLHSIERTILVNLEEAERQQKLLDKSRKELTAQQIKDREESIKYRQAVAEKYKQNYKNVREIGDETKRRIHELFSQLHAHCAHSHQNLRTNFELGFYYLLEGKADECIANARYLMETSSKEEINSLKGTYHIRLAQAYFETGVYEQTIKLLSELLTKDENNKEALLLRAEAYFALGQFDQALSDYSRSNLRPEEIDAASFPYKEARAFYEGWSQGSKNGLEDATVAFFPALFRDPYGLGHGLMPDRIPLLVVKDVKEAASQYVQALSELIAKEGRGTKEETGIMVHELQEALMTWKSLTPLEAGEKIGYVIGKYGADQLRCNKRFKINALARDLRRAISLQTLEMMRRTKEGKEDIARRAEAFELKRQITLDRYYFINSSKQGRYQSWYPEIALRKKMGTCSVIITHNNLQGLVHRYAGTGLGVYKSIPGAEGYQEVIDFGEPIGLWVGLNDEVRHTTTRGMINYDTDGRVYVVPLRPRYVPPSAPQPGHGE